MVAIEKLTRERRRQLTRDVLTAAATEVFARRGYEGASLDEIAETAGFTRGAIYKNFGGKEDLFFHVIDHLNEQTIEAFRSLVPDFPDTKEWDLSTLADLWRASVSEFDELYVIGLEYDLYILRNPDSRTRAIEHRRKRRDLVASFIDEVAQSTGMTLRLPSDTLAAIILASADGLTYTMRVDGENLFEPFLALLNAGMVKDQAATVEESRLGQEPARLADLA